MGGLEPPPPTTIWYFCSYVQGLDVYFLFSSSIVREFVWCESSKFMVQTANARRRRREERFFPLKNPRAETIVGSSRSRSAVTRQSALRRSLGYSYLSSVARRYRRRCRFLFFLPFRNFAGRCVLRTR